MNTNYVSSQIHNNESAKNRTLKTLFQVICADHEFTLLRQTLELYCEEIALQHHISEEASVTCSQ